MRSILVIVNPYATAVSPRARAEALKTLAGAFHVEAVDTDSPGHAIELARHASAAQWDAVAAFGGDGTVNEVANGLSAGAHARTAARAPASEPRAVPAGVAAGTSGDAPAPAQDAGGTGEGARLLDLREPLPLPPPALICIPGGQANVLARMLGMPRDARTACAHLVAAAADRPPRRMDLGVVNGRRFTFASGVGVDASVTRAVDSKPRLKARFGAWYYTWAALSIVARRYLPGAPRMTVRIPAPAGGPAQARTVEGITAVVQNGSPYTYFNSRPIEVAQESSLDSGSLAGGVLLRARPGDVPSLAWRALSKRAPLAGHRQVSAFSGVSELTITASDGAPLPLHVDGDYLGDVAMARYSVLPGALAVIA